MKLWDIATGAEVCRFEHTFKVVDVAFSADGKLALSAGLDKTVRVWDLDDQQEIATLEFDAGVSAIDLSPDDNWLAVGGSDGSLTVWKVTQGRESWLDPTGKPLPPRPLLRTFTAEVAAHLMGHSDWISSVAFSADNRHLVSAGRDALAKVWDLEAEQREVRSFEGHDGSVRDVAFSADGRLALTASRDTTLKLWDVETGEEIKTFEGHEGTVMCVAFSPSQDEHLALSGSFDNNVKLWNLENGTCIHTFKEHQDVIMGVALSPEGDRALSASLDGTVKIWDPASMKLIRSESTHFDPSDDVGVKDVAVAFHNGSLRALSSAKTTKLWDVNSGRVEHELEFNAVGVAFSPDGKKAVLGSTNGDLVLWDLLETPDEFPFDGHSLPILGVAYSHDGRFVLSASHDNTVKLWDAETRGLLCSCAGHKSTVDEVAFSPDQFRALSAGWDKTAKLWDFGRGEQYRNFAVRLQEARAKLQTNRHEAHSLRVIGEWYAFRGVWDWAIESLEEARAAGDKDVSHLTLARCYWQHAKQSQDEADLAAARREFEQARDNGEASEFYVNLCLEALERTNLLATSPASND